MEIECFVIAFGSSWLFELQLWGLHREDGQMAPLGINVHEENLWFARFIESSPPRQWHGFPADYRRHNYDRPPNRILKQWRDAGILMKHEMAKVAAGKRCKRLS